MAGTDPDALAAQIAEKVGAPRGAIADIVLATTTDGAASLEVALIDPDLDIVEADTLTPRDRRFYSGDPDIQEAEQAAGHGPYALPRIEVNYPDGSSWWWRLSDIDLASDLDGANVTLTFEARIVAYLRSHHGPPMKAMSRAKTTRARFIKWITADEVKAGGGIRFISPEIDEAQPILEPEV